MTRSELATWIVRMGEKYPDRMVRNRGNDGLYAAPFCILGQICEELKIPKPQRINRIYATSEDRDNLPCQAFTLNDCGVAWGEIPKRLKLVPGELPASPEPVPSEVACVEA